MDGKNVSESVTKRFKKIYVLVSMTHYMSAYLIHCSCSPEEGLFYSEIKNASMIFFVTQPPSWRKF